MHTPRSVRLAAGLLLLTATAVGCSGDGSPSPFESLPVKVGFKIDRPGMSDLTDKGVYDGFEPHLTMRVLDSRKIDYTSLTVTTANWVDALNDGKANHNKVDLVVADISERDSLKQEFDLAGPYLQTPLGVLLKADDDRTVAKSEDLKPLRVCVSANTTASAQLQDIGPRVTVTGADLKECLARVDDGTADAVLSDYLVLQGVAVNSGSGGRRAYRVARDAHIGKTQYLMMVLPKGHQKACTVLRQAINDYLQDPDWMIALRTYFGFGPEFTDKELRDTFKPVTTASGDRCSA